MANAKKKKTKFEYEQNIKSLNNAISEITKKAKRAIALSNTHVYITSGDALIICTHLKRLIKYYRKEIQELERK